MNHEDEEDKSSMSSDDESMGSLKEFIVEEENESESSETESESDDETELTEESDEDDESDDSDDEEAEAEEAEEAEESKQDDEKNEGPKTKKIRLSKEKQDEIEELKAEAERFISGSSGTHVGGRTLRSRDAEAIEKRKPKDTYYEKYAKQEEAKLMEKFLKKDIIDFLKKLEPEWRESFEATGRTWPSPKITMSLETIQDMYKPVKEFANLPDSDEEDSDEGEILSDEDISDLESEESI